MQVHALAAALLIGLLHSVGAAQEPIDSPMIAAIRAEGLERSEASELLYTLTDVLGPRLSGSPAYDEAARWAVERSQGWGLENARLEPFGFGRAWTLEGLTAEMVAPRYMPLIGYAEAWSPSTDGLVTGTPIYLGDSTREEIEAMGSRLEGAIVLTARPQEAFLSEDRPQPAEGEGPVVTGNPPFPSPSSLTPRTELLSLLRVMGAAVAVGPAATEHGTVRVQGNGLNAPDAVPTIVVAAEQYNMLVRLTESGEPIEIAFEVRVAMDVLNLDSNNVLAEIPGTDPILQNEIVLIGAHLDSWHTATGATDNADGVASVMEAMRILSAIGAQPRRTIRIALWGGEEQGLLGSRAWVDANLDTDAARSQIAVYLNDDPGSGPTYGFYMEENPAAKGIFDAWLAPLSDLGVRRNIIEGIGSTDHVPFVGIGVPAFNTIKEFEHYDVRTRHTNVDHADAVNIDGVRQSAIVMAVFAWHAAMRDERIPGRE